MRCRLAACVLLALVTSACSGGTSVGGDGHGVDRLLVVSLPGLSWSDVGARDLPNLRAFATDAAVGNLATRVGRRSATTEDAYLTIGAGTRAVAPDAGGGVVLEGDELYHGEPAVAVLQRRLGRVPEGAAAYLAMGAARDANDGSVFGAEIGLLGERLAAADVHRAVIANADLREGRTDDAAYGRAAAAMLMGADGIVPEGVVGRQLLRDDADAPYGVRLDRHAVLEAFDEAWESDRVVTVVEASDLKRATEYGRLAAPASRARMRAAALRDADDLLGALLDRVGPRDAVLIVSPVAPAGAPDLGIVALRTPDVAEGLLRSATTRRTGYVQLADVGPTVLAVLGEETPEHVEGRAFRVVERRSDVDDLADAGALAAFRDDIVPVTVTVLIAVLALLSLATAVRRRLPDAVGRALPLLACGFLGALPATFLTATAGIDSLGLWLAFVTAGGVAVAIVSAAVDRRRPGAGIVVGVGSVVVLIAADVTVGAPLQLNTVFGYSVAVAGRFAGVGNLAFALFGAAAIVLAALLAERHRGVRPWHALAVLAVVLLVDGLPVLGADVGGILSMVPAFGLAGLVLLSRRVGGREIAAVAVAAVGLLLTVAFIDLLRPDESQTHLARLAQHVLDNRWEPFLDSLARRWFASFGSGQTGAWVVLAVVAGIVGATVAARTVSHRALPLRIDSRPEAAAALGLAVLAGLGLVTNDSSFAVPATMLLVVVPVVVHRVTAAEAR